MSEPSAPEVDYETGQAQSWLSFLVQFIRLTRDYWWAGKRWPVWILSGILIVSTVAQVGIPVAINLWSNRFFTALEERAMDQLGGLVAAIGGIIAASVVVATIQLRVRRRLQVGWREWLTRRMTDEWMVSARHYQLDYMPGEHDNPDGRIAEDARIATESAIDLGVSLLYCATLLVSFTQILWSLSVQPLFHIDGHALTIPGYLVWIAVIYASIGSGLALLLGRPLVRATYDRQAAEADFRFGLVHARENSEAIALVRGEDEARNRLYDLFKAAIKAWSRQTSAYIKISFYTSSWSVLWQTFPVLVAAPRYIEGVITLGVLMQTAQALQQMISALSWPIDNLSALAQWRASVNRVLVFENAIAGMRAFGGGENGGRLKFVSTNGTDLALKKVSVMSAPGFIDMGEMDLVVRQGEGVAIGGDPGAVEELFKVVAGIWPWGDGTIERPEAGRMMFMPHLPYLPLGTLRSAILFPEAPGRRKGENEVETALNRLGLDHLVSRLDSLERWDHVLEIDAVQRLGFVRLLLRKPDWVFLSEATDALGPAGERQVLELIKTELPNATLVIFGENTILTKLTKRHYALARSGGVVRLKEAVEPWITRLWRF